MSSDKQLQQTFDTQRIPLYDTQNQNKVYLTGLNQMAGELYWNCYPVVDKNILQNDGEVQVHKRPGITSLGVDFLTNGNTGPDKLTSGHVYNVIAHMALQSVSSTNVCIIWDKTAGTYNVMIYGGATGFIKAGTITGGPNATNNCDYLYISETVIAGQTHVLVTMQTIVFSGASTSTAYYAQATLGGVFSTAGLTIMNAAYAAGFPNNLTPADPVQGPLVAMDGYVFAIGASGYIYNSDANSLSSWNTLGKVGAIQSPDLGVGLARYKNFILAFGTSSLEFFTNVAAPAPGSPLQRTDQAFARLGTTSAKSIVCINDDVYWLARSTEGIAGLYHLGGGYTPTKISSDKTTEQLQTQSATTNIWLQSFYDGVRQHVITTIPAAPMLLSSGTYSGSDPNSLISSDVGGSAFNGWLCISLDTGDSWAFHTHAPGLTTSLLPVSCGIFTQFQNPYSTSYVGWCQGNPFNGVGVQTNIGNALSFMYNMVSDGGVWTDSFSFQSSSQGYTYAAGIQFNTFDFGTEKRKRIHKMKIVQNGNAIIAASAPWNHIVYIKEPNYMASNWSTGQTIYTRPIDPTTTNARWYINNLGAARYWGFGIVRKGDGPWRVRYLEADLSQGTS